MRQSSWVVMGPALVLAVLVALPLGFVVLQAVFPQFASGSFADPFGKLTEVLQDEALPELTFNTLRLGMTVVALSALLGIPLGLIRATYQLPGAAFWDVLFLVPFMIPPYIAALGWIMLLQPSGYLQQLTGVHLSGFLFSMQGVAFVMTLNVFPVVYFALSRAVPASRLVEAARVHGATPWQSLWRVVLPLSLPAILASLLLVFSMSIEEYGTPAALAANAGFFVLVTGIERRFSDWPIDLSGASVLSLILVALAMLAFWLQRRLLANTSFDTRSGKPSAVVKRPLGQWQIPVVMMFAVVAFIATAAPLFSIVSTASTRTLSGGLTFDNLTLLNFEAIFSSGTEAWQALRTSLTLAVVSALLTGFIGVSVAYVVVKTRSKGRALLDGLSMLPNTIPGVVVAIGLILLWNQPMLPITPYNTVLILLLAYCCLLLPYPVRYANAALAQLGNSLEEAARVHGATRFVAVTRILLPLLWPSMLASMLLVFAVASRELVATLLLAPSGVQTVATFIWRQFEQGSIGQGMAMSVVTIAITAVITFWVARRAGGQLKA